MPRKTREQTIEPGQPNHITCRGNNRRRLFSYPREYLRYIALLSTELVKNGCVLHAACLMANHVHLLLTPTSVEAVSRMLGRINQRYAQIRNTVRDGSGKLFEQAFKSTPIKDDAHLSNSIAYIHANPYVAGIKSAPRYRWSTHSFYAGHDQPTHLDDLVRFTDWYKQLGSSSSERQREYQKVFEVYLRENKGIEIETYKRRLERPNRKSAR